MLVDVVKYTEEYHAAYTRMHLAQEIEFIQKILDDTTNLDLIKKSSIDFQVEKETCSDYDSGYYRFHYELTKEIVEDFHPLLEQILSKRIKELDETHIS